MEEFVCRYEGVDEGDQRGWRYPWQEEDDQGTSATRVYDRISLHKFTVAVFYLTGNRDEEKENQQSIRIPSLLEHRFQVPLTLPLQLPSLQGEGEGEGGAKEEMVEVVLSGVLDRVDLVYPAG